MRQRISKEDIRDIKKLYRNGHSNHDIVKLSGHPYHIVQYHTQPLSKRKKKAPTQKAPASVADTKDYKALYLKAVMLLIQNGIIDLEVEL